MKGSQTTFPTSLGLVMCICMKQTQDGCTVMRGGGAGVGAGGLYSANLGYATVGFYL